MENNHEKCKKYINHSFKKRWSTMLSKAAYEEIKEYVLEKYGLKVSQLYIAQVKRKILHIHLNQLSIMF